MTPYLTATAASIPAPPKPSKDASAVKETEGRTVFTDKNDDISKDSSGFEELMAGLLNAVAPAQTQPVVKTVANDISITGTSTTPLVVVPQNTSASTLAAPTVSGDFSQELLSALTPGTPAIPVSDVPVDLPPVAVPVLAQKSDTVKAFTPTPELTIDPQTPAEPLLIASGLSPNQMQSVKDQVTTPASQTTVKTDAAPIMTVAITPDKNAPVITAVAAEIVVTSAPKTTVTATPKPAAITAPVVTSDAPVDTASITAEGFDPVEFRIAQGFQRPASSSMSSLTNAQAPMQAAPDTGYQGNAATTTTANIVTKGKIDLPALSSSSPSISTMLPADALNTADTLSATPVATPMIANPLTSPIVQSNSATQSIPAVQTVATIINKAAKEGGPQTISLRLDPPDLGKLEVQMKYNKGDPLKVHLVVEKADTAQMFQKDAHVLESALRDAGIQTDGSSLSFEFSQNSNAFDQAMNQGQSSKGQNQAWTPPATQEAASLETSMDIFTDSRTGLTHYNIRA